MLPPIVSTSFVRTATTMSQWLQKVDLERLRARMVRGPVHELRGRDHLVVVDALQGRVELAHQGTGRVLRLERDCLALLDLDDPALLQAEIGKVIDRLGPAEHVPES